MSISSRPSFRCNSTLRLVLLLYSSFQFVSTLLNAVRYFFPFRFNSSLLFPIPRSFRFELFSALRYFLPIVSTLPSCSLSFISSFPFTAFILLLPFLLFQCVHPVRLPLPFVSSRSFRYLISYLSFASTLLSCSSCSSFPFNSSVSLRPSFRCNSSLPFVTSFLSFPPFFIPSFCKFLVGLVLRNSKISFLFFILFHFESSFFIFVSAFFPSFFWTSF